MTEARDVSVPFSGQLWGELKVVGGLAHAELTALKGTVEAPSVSLLEATFEGLIPRVKSEGSRVSMTYDFWAGWRMRSHSAQLGLSQAVPWSLAVQGGVSHLHASLKGIRLHEIVVDGGLHDVLLELDEAHGHVPIRIHGGVDKLTIVRPHGTSIAVRARGGATDLTLDKMSLAAVGGNLVWQSDPDSGDGYYDLQILGGVSRLLVACKSPRDTLPPSIPHRSASVTVRKTASCVSG